MPWPTSYAAVADRGCLPKFSDGRSYSTARLLRERLGFKGELRAVGDVLADQIPLMRRCGIESFEVKHAPTRAALFAGKLAEMHHFYQPIATAPREVPAGTRPWLQAASAVSFAASPTLPSFSTACYYFVVTGAIAMRASVAERWEMRRE